MNNVVYPYFLPSTEFVTADITVAVSFSSIPTAGDQLNVTCTATVPQRLVYTPSTVVISYNSGGQQVVAEDNADATQSEVSQDGNVFSKVVTIDPVKTTDARRYYCLVAFGQPLDTINFTNADLQVYSMLIDLLCIL